MTLIEDIKKWWREPAYRRSQEYRKALKVYEDMCADGNPSFDLDAIDVKLDFAQQQYDRVESVFETLDQKAEAQYRFAAVVIGALIAATKVIGHVPLVTATDYPILLLIAGTVFALAGRFTKHTPTPMKVDTALGLNGRPKQVKGLLAASLYPTIEGFKSVNGRKARFCDLSQICIILALIWGAIAFSWAH